MLRIEISDGCDGESRAGGCVPQRKPSKPGCGLRRHDPLRSPEGPVNDLSYALGGPFTVDQVALVTVPTNRELDARWAGEFAELVDVDRLHQLGFTETDIPDAGPADQLAADHESPNVITSEWVLATVAFPGGRTITAKWPYEILEGHVLTNPGTTAHIL